MIRLTKKIIQKSANVFGYNFEKKAAYAVADPVMNGDVVFNRIYNQCKDYTWTTKERMYALYNSVIYIVKGNLPGDFVECGVWKGGSAMLIAHTLLELKVTNRKIYLYDTYTGMAKPTKEDTALHQGTDSLPIWEKNQKEGHNAWGYAPLEEVKKNMESTGYPAKNFVYVKGMVEDTIPKTISKQISLLRLDTDFYASTKHELKHLYPLLVKNGVLLIDDYGHFAGAKQAVDEYFKGKNILLTRIDYTGRLAIKT